jgi:ribonuclease BN (tRNA processing enzyme)
MRVHLCGVRGSTPSPGPAYARYGGNTSCVAIARDDTDPTLLLDAGTGLRNVGALLDGRAFVGSLLLTHLHWDHTQGLPFFPAGDRPDARVDVWLPSGEDPDPLAGLDRLMSPPLFPITARQLRGGWTFHGWDEGRHEVEGFDVLAREVPHPGGRTFGYRVSDGRAVVTYVSDHGPVALGAGEGGDGPYHDAIVELAAEADVLLHDAQFTSAELALKPHFGHSSIDYALGLAAFAGVGQVVLFHHDPWRTDDALDAVAAEVTRAAVKAVVAVEGDTLEL